MSSVGALLRDSSVSPLAWLFAAASSFIIGAGVVLLAEAGPMWLVLLVAGLFGAAAVLWSRRLVDSLVAAVAFCAPIALTKTLFVGAGIFAPALELTLVDILLVLLVPAWLWHRRVRPARPSRIGHRPLLAYFLWTWVTVLWADVPMDAVAAAISLSRFFVLFVVLADLVDTPRRLRVVLHTGAAGLMLQLIVVAAQLATHSSLLVQGSKGSDDGLTLLLGQMDVFRPSGLVLHPNNLASYLLIVLPVLGCLLLLGERRLGRVQWWTILALFIASAGALASTMSRGGWISAVLGAIFVLVVCRRWQLISSNQSMLALGGGTVIALLILVAYPAALLRLTSPDQGSTRSRLLLMAQATEILKHHAVLGVGLASYTAASPSYIPAEFTATDSVTRRAMLAVPVHNHYLWLWVERGIVGVGLLLAIHLSFLRALFRKRVWAGRDHRMLGVALSAGVFAHLSMYAFEPFSVDSRWISVWVGLSLLSAVLRFVPDGTFDADALQPGKPFGGAR